MHQETARAAGAFRVSWTAAHLASRDFAKTSAGELEHAFARAHDMQVDLARKERAVGRRIQTLARGQR